MSGERLSEAERKALERCEGMPFRNVEIVCALVRRLLATPSASRGEGLAVERWEFRMRDNGGPWKAWQATGERTVSDFREWGFQHEGREWQVRGLAVVRHEGPDATPPTAATPTETERVLQRTVRALENLHAAATPSARDSVALGCFHAAFFEGWIDALANGDIERIRDLWARRLSFAYTALLDSEAPQ